MPGAGKDGFYRFFAYAADLSLFLETGKGLTCGVFTESLTSGRIDDYGITFWKARQNSCLGPERMVFACPRARDYGVRSEVELNSMLAVGVALRTTPTPG